MTWREELRSASYRGVPFEVESHDLSSGRRGSLHEYPERDTPYFDDLGRRARRFSVEAFVIGDEYTAQRDALLRACERPGVGILSHPYYGELRVVCREFSVNESRRDGGMARFALSFIEAGQDLFPTENIFSAGASGEAADGLEADTIDAFDRSFDIRALSGSARDAIASKIDEIAGGVLADLGAAEDVLNAVNDVISDIPGLITTPRNLAFRAFGLARTIAANIEDVAAIPAAFFDFDFLSSSPSGNSPSEIATRTANQAAQSLFRRAQLSTEARVLAEQNFDTSNEVITALAAFVQRVDAEESAATPIDDVANPALLNLRTRVANDLRARAGLLPILTLATVTESTPAVVLAYRLYDDSGRDTEIVRRNRVDVPHPLFIPPQNVLEVLSQ